MKHSKLKKKNYKQLSFEEIIKIETLFGLDFNITQIAECLNRCKSTISREIKRNGRKNSNGKNLGYESKLATKGSACGVEDKNIDEINLLVKKCISPIYKSG